MIKNVLKRLWLIAPAFLLLSFLMPQGWRISGQTPEKYEIGLFKAGGYNGSSNCGVIRASKKDYFENEYASMIQTISSQRYLGRRIRLTGYMKCRGVTAWAGLFIRVDNDLSKEPLTFDNMHDRAMTGSMNWTQKSVEIDVPLNGSKITFGALLHGAGIVFFDDLMIEDIGPSTIVSDHVLCDTSLKRGPENMDFEM